MIRSVPGYDDNYWVSDQGEVFKKLRCNHTHHQGYVRVRLQLPGLRDGRPKQRYFLVHRLVAEAFVENPDQKPEVNHLNNVKNDNESGNLEWCTASENCLHREKFRRVSPWANRTR